MSSKNLTIPNILILDLDNTIIGSSIYHMYYNDLKGFLLNLSSKNKIKMKMEDHNKLKNKNLKYDDIMRPGFIEFINFIKDEIPNSEVFIYSAATLNYITSYIEYIEKNHRIKINRPFFSRNQTLVESNAEKQEIDFKKSLNLVIGKVKSLLNKKYPDLKKINMTTLLTNNVMFIDNRSDILVDNEENLLVCPDYNFKALLEFNRLIPEYLYSNKMINTYIHGYINDGVKDKLIYEYREGLNKYEYKEKYYAWLSSKYNIAKKDLNKKNEDKFYQTMIHILSKYKAYSGVFGRKNIQLYKKYINSINKKKSSSKESKSSELKQALKSLKSKNIKKIKIKK